MRMLASGLAATLVFALAGAQNAPTSVTPPRPPPPTRPADGPGAPHWTVITGAGKSAPVDAEGDYLIGPEYLPAPELTVVAGVPQGAVQQFLMKSEDSKIY